MGSTRPSDLRRGKRFKPCNFFTMTFPCCDQSTERLPAAQSSGYYSWFTETTLMQQTTASGRCMPRLTYFRYPSRHWWFWCCLLFIELLKTTPHRCVLKIDKIIYRWVLLNHNDHMLDWTIIQLGHNMGKVEGVVNDEQLSFVGNRRLDEYQGYLLLSVPPYEFMALLSSRKDVAIPRPQVAAHG